MYLHRQTESDAQEPIVQVAQVGSKQYMYVHVLEHHNNMFHMNDATYLLQDYFAFYNL